ncbi:hypothetical protein K435DRAFT_804595 [Dendrothele bispora CBS 962.96]|uniref:Uncharacterized protein n=1 Tax=Dendrothele bispora (strain CBS 962.96) TaxID=1314807 RepID=A0A4S8LF62_DENBC|nr:hypothetical protein K435DRAFT_804595 [Dendrothele bispora CBS 962.96]
MAERFGREIGRGNLAMGMVKSRLGFGGGTEVHFDFDRGQEEKELFEDPVDDTDTYAFDALSTKYFTQSCWRELAERVQEAVVDALKEFYVVGNEDKEETVTLKTKLTQKGVQRLARMVRKRFEGRFWDLSREEDASYGVEGEGIGRTLVEGGWRGELSGFQYRKWEAENPVAEAEETSSPAPSFIQISSSQFSEKLSQLSTQDQFQTSHFKFGRGALSEATEAADGDESNSRSMISETSDLSSSYAEGGDRRDQVYARINTEKRKQGFQVINPDLACPYRLLLPLVRILKNKKGKRKEKQSTPPPPQTDHSLYPYPYPYHAYSSSNLHLNSLNPIAPSPADPDPTFTSLINETRAHLMEAHFTFILGRAVGEMSRGVLGDGVEVEWEVEGGAVGSCFGSGSASSGSNSFRGKEKEKKVPGKARLAAALLPCLARWSLERLFSLGLPNVVNGVLGMREVKAWEEVVFGEF